MRSYMFMIQRLNKLILSGCHVDCRLGQIGQSKVKTFKFYCLFLVFSFISFHLTPEKNNKIYILLLHSYNLYAIVFVLKIFKFYMLS